MRIIILATLNQMFQQQLWKLRQWSQSPAEAAQQRQLLLAGIAEGLRQSAAGETLDEAEARARLGRWLLR